MPSLFDTLPQVLPNAFEIRISKTFMVQSTQEENETFTAEMGRLVMGLQNRGWNISLTDDQEGWRIVRFEHPEFSQYMAQKRSIWEKAEKIFGNDETSDVDSPTSSKLSTNQD